MKLFLVGAAAAFTVVFTGCVSSSSSRSAAVATPAPTSETVSASDLIANEKAVWNAYKDKNAAALADLLADDSYVVEAADGEVMTKAETLAALNDFTIDDYEMKNLKVISISPEVAIVRYNVMAKGSSGGKPFLPHWSTVSSVWVNRNGKWKNLVYQETQIQHHH